MAKPRLPRMRLAVLAAVVLVAFWAVTLWAVGRLGLEGWPRYAVLGTLGVLGLALAGAVYWFSSKLLKSRAAPPATPEADELRSLIANARNRLETAESSKAPFSEMPLLLVIGAQGSAKSTLILEGGLEAELLSGSAQRGSRPEPTRTANFWYSDGTIYAEASSAVVASDDLWEILMTAVRPRRLRAYFTREGQAPRAIVVCVSARSMADPRSADSYTKLAQELRARLFETAQELGVQLPVYVVFTKTDEVEHFDEFVRNFTDEEANRVLGTTLPYQDLKEAADYAASQAGRTRSALEAIFRSLALKRLTFLRREAVTQRAASAYEFPREFRKLQESIVRFVVELVRPSQFRVSPFLRGMYFVGRRRVDVQDAGPVAPAVDQGSSFGATRIFSPADIAASVPAPSGTTRRGEQWVFLKRVLRDVILRDESVLALTTGGSKVTRGQRLVLSGIIAFLVFAALGSTLSFFNNRRVGAAVAREIAALDQLPRGAPTGSSLATLDTARVRVVQLQDWEGSRPLTYRMGLYRGSRLYEALRPAYFRAFERSLYGVARDSLEQALAGLPGAPDETADYLSTYDKLKTYRILMDTAGASSPEFVSPVLLAHTPGLAGDNAGILADSQYTFFARELASDNPFPGTSSNAAVVEHARTFLRQAGSIEPFFARMISQASQGSPGAPDGSLPGLQVPAPVSAAFTTAGRAAVEQFLAQPDAAIVQTEEWVVGPGAQIQDASEVRAALTTRYEDSYISEWRRMVLGTRVAPFQTSAEGVRRITELTETPGSMGQFVQMVGRNQTPDSLRTTFRPIQAFLTTDSTGAINPNGGISDRARTYRNELIALGGALRSLSEAEAEAVAGAADQVDQQAQSARIAASGLSDAFGLAPENASIRGAVEDLLTDPIQWASDAARGERNTGVLAPLITLGNEFCQNFTAEIGNKFPFDPGSPTEATLEDLATVFQRGNSRVWNVENRLVSDGHIEQVGPRYEAVSDAPISPDFLRFLSSARRFSEGIYPEGSDSPLIQFSVQPVRDAQASFSFSFDSRSLECSLSTCQSERYDWRGSPGDAAELAVEVGGRRYVDRHTGRWALFRLFGAATGWGSGQTHQLRWTIMDTGQPVLAGGEPVVVRMDVTLNSSVPVFDANLLNGLRRCVPIIAN